MNYTSNMGMNMPDENDKFSIEHFNTNTQALDIVGKPDEYKNTKTYAVGDLCIHNNILYKCIIAVETAEEFNAEKWEVTSLCKEEIANKTAIAELNEKMQCGTFDFTISQREAAYVVQFPKEFKKIPVVTLSIERGGFTTTTFYHIQNGYNTTKQFAFLAVCTDPGTANTACKAHWIAREP